MLDRLPSLAPDAQLRPDDYRIGAGGEHIVFNEPVYTWEDDGVAFVRKVNIPLIHTFQGLPRREAFEQALAYAHELNARHNGLVEVFGQSHVPWQFTRPHLMPLSDREKAVVWPNGAPTASSVVYTILTHQDRIAALEAPDAQETLLSFDAPYAERQEQQVDPETYVKIQQRWLTDASYDNMLHSTETEDFLAMQNNPNFLVAFHALGSVAVNTALAEFVGKAIQYSRTRGEILDIFGENNVILERQGGYQLLDALMTSPRKQYWLVQEVFDNLRQQKLLSFRERIDLLNGLQYVRTLNFTACLLGLDDRLDVLPGQELPDSTWKAVHEYLTRLPRTREINMATKGY